MAQFQVPADNDLEIINTQFTNISDQCINIQSVDLGNIKIQDCEFTQPSGNSTIAINCVIPTDPFWGSENEHAEFDSLQIQGNTISDFKTGIKLQFKDSQNNLNWNSSSVERVMVDHNEVSQCDSGISVTGDILYFSHHNLIDSCDVGYAIQYPTLNDHGTCDELRYRLINETIIGDGNSVGIRDLNPEPTRPYQAESAFIGSDAIFQ